MSILDLYGEDTMAAASRFIKPAPVEPKFSAWSLMTAPARGVGEAAAQAMASGAELAAGWQHFRDTPSKDMPAGLPADALQSDLADSLRDRGRSFRPDPVTASAAEQILYGLTRGASKIVAGALAAGPAGVVGAGIEEGMSVADDLRRQGVTDPAVRAQAGALQGAGLALAALPAVGATLKATAGLYAVGGPGGFMAQQALTRKILADAGHGDIGAQFDPFDPVGLAVSSLIPAAFAAWGIRGQRRAAAQHSPEVVDAARVALATELRASVPVEPALVRAEDAVARGDPVQVSDLVPPTRIMSLDEFVASNKIDDPAIPPEIPSGFIGWLRQKGGINIGEKFDITGEKNAVLSNPGSIFRRHGNGSDELASMAIDEHYLAPGADSGDLVNLVQAAIRGEGVFKFEEAQHNAARSDALFAMDGRRQAVEEKLQLLGVDPTPALGRVAVMEAYVKAHEHQLLGAALDELRAARSEFDAIDEKAAQILADMNDSGRTLAQYEAEVSPLSPSMRKAVQQQAEPPGAAVPASEAALGKPRDLQAETIALRRESAVLSRLLECLNG